MQKKTSPRPHESQVKFSAFEGPWDERMHFWRGYVLSPRSLPSTLCITHAGYRDSDEEAEACQRETAERRGRSKKFRPFSPLPSSENEIFARLMGIEGFLRAWITNYDEREAAAFAYGDDICNVIMIWISMLLATAKGER